LALPDKAHETIDIEIQTLDDFHPDKLLNTVAPLAALIGARTRLLNRSTFSDAARELQALLATRPTPAEAPAKPPAGGESNEATLTRLLGGTAPPAASTHAPPATTVERLIRNIVTPSVVPDASPEQTALLSAVDLELSRRLRAILHHPDFQSIEAAWRGLDMLVRTFGGEENIKLCVVDISKQEIEADLMAQENLEPTGLNQLLQKQADDQPWAAWVGLYTLGSNAGDLVIAGRLAKLAARAGAPFLAGAHPILVGCDSFGSRSDPGEWKQPLAPEAAATLQALCELPEARYIALSLPRFLLRQPYGRHSDPIEAFTFEEMSPDIQHERYLWGNPAVLCGHMLAEAFRADGWEMQPAGFGEIGDLPLYKFKENGETAVKPCAEAWLSQRAADAIAAKGLVPIMSIKGRDAVRVGPFRSLGKDPAELAGRWG
jgi:type VI secretion system protein ImpC